MADDFFRPLPGARQALMDVLGLATGTLDLRTRSAIEALCEEVIFLREDVAALGRALKDAEALADHDALCPVFNRRAFEREVRREIAVSGRFRTPLSLIFVDLDNFKPVNDGFGHAAGDDVLLSVSAILLRHTRETDIVGRLGGDEFGIVLTQASAADSVRKAQQLSAMVDALVVRDVTGGARNAVHIGASCGVVQWQPGQDESVLISLADQAMFAEKARRKASRGST
jgi:diguanylate cyclase (GGDEF)-like protein